MLARLRIASHCDWTEWCIEDVPIEYVTLEWLQEAIFRLSAANNINGAWSLPAAGDKADSTTTVGSAPHADSFSSETDAAVGSSSVVGAARRHKVVEIASRYLAQLPPPTRRQGGVDRRLTFADTSCVLLRLNGRSLIPTLQQDIARGGRGGGSRSSERLMAILQRHLGGQLSVSANSGGKQVLCLTLHAYPCPTDVEGGVASNRPLLQTGVSAVLVRSPATHMPSASASPTRTAGDAYDWGASTKEAIDRAASGPYGEHRAANPSQQRGVLVDPPITLHASRHAIAEVVVSPPPEHRHRGHDDDLVAGGASLRQRQEVWDVSAYHTGQAYARSKHAAEERFTASPRSSPAGRNVSAHVVSVSLQDDETPSSPAAGGAWWSQFSASPEDAISPPRRIRESDIAGPPTTTHAVGSMVAASDRVHHHLHHIRISLDD